MGGWGMSDTDDTSTWNTILEPPLGAPIHRVAEAVVQEVRKTKNPRSFLFNGRRIYVSTEDTAELVMERYAAGCLPPRPPGVR